MRGTLLVFQPHSLPQVTELSQPPTLEEVQAVVGGDLQLVPGFRTIRFGNVVMDCVALCDAGGTLFRSGHVTLAASAAPVPAESSFTPDDSNAATIASQYSASSSEALIFLRASK